MAITLTEAQSQLASINAAIEQLVQGKRVTQLVVGSGSFRRQYTYQEISLEMLKELRDDLLKTIDVLEPATPNFKSNMTIPMLVGKDIF